MTTHKRRREDDSTFGFGRYPKRSRRECIGHERDYHSVSVSCLQHGRRDSRMNGLKSCDHNLYHYSLSSELYARNSHSTGQRYSTCSSNTSQRNKRLRGYQIPTDGRGYFRTKLLRDGSPVNSHKNTNRV